MFARLHSRLGAAQPYWLTRFLILRLLGFVYFFAFLSLAQQVLPLIGRDGLLPARSYLAGIERAVGSRFDAFLALPSLFWLGAPDRLLVVLAWAGVALSLAVALGFANAVLLAALWALYLSFVQIGQDWYGFGWEIQLLETGFLAIFLCPLLDGRPFPRRPPPVVVIVLLRWLIVRIMLGAGLIKIRGDACWRDLTCLYYHYETQPIPNPLSRALHFMPHWFHKAGVLANHATELGAPWFAFGPRILRRAAGILFVLFQIFLIASGNLSFLNYLTIIPALACFDDVFLARLLPRRLVERAARAEREAQPSPAQNRLAAGLALVVAVLSVAPVANLVSSGQIMNTSFDRLHLVNTYGAFGSVGRERFEIVFEGTADPSLSDATRWREYEFKCKPGDPYRRPCIMSPYQYRLAWQIWFAAMSTPDNYPWTLHLVWKLLHNDAPALRLLQSNPFPDAPPRFVRAQLYSYRFAPPGEPGGAWWRRERLGPWLPPLETADPGLRRMLEAYGWLSAASTSLGTSGRD
ncbi:MAG: membrane protein [Acidobacteria bacterium]|nr:MAG: membrane protein [Acidobacteriota bacterium]